jgi:hypothetical protein
MHRSKRPYSFTKQPILVLRLNFLLAAYSENPDLSCPGNSAVTFTFLSDSVTSILGHATARPSPNAARSKLRKNIVKQVVHFTMKRPYWINIIATSDGYIATAPRNEISHTHNAL